MEQYHPTSMIYYQYVKLSEHLRSSTSCDIKPIFCKTEQAKQGFFSAAGPRTWNNLPKEVKEKANHLKFNKKLKTHLFKKLYPE